MTLFVAFDMRRVKVRFRLVVDPIHIRLVTLFKLGSMSYLRHCHARQDCVKSRVVVLFERYV
jgi:hypothetical protein